MKKVLSKTLCDTKTATKLGGYDNGYGVRDFHYLEQELYRTKSGKYFLYSFGGAATRYAERVDANSYTGGEAIELLEPEEAEEWAENHLDGDDYIAAFGEPDEAESCRMSITLSAAARRKLDTEREKTGDTLNSIIERMILSN